MSSKKTEVAVATTEPTTALVPAAPAGGLVLADFADELLADAAAAPATFAAEDVAIPFVRILQAISPECKPRDPKFVEGAKAGMFINTVTKQLYDTVHVIPVAFRRSYTEWKLRDGPGGGGFVKDHGSNDAVLQYTTKDDKNRDITPDGTQIVFALLYYVLVLDPTRPGAPPEQALLSLSSTQLKKGRQWNSLIAQTKITLPDGRIIAPPMWYRVYELSAVGESNDKGSWEGYRITAVGDVTTLPNGAQVYKLGKEFHELVTAGTVNVRMDMMTEAEAEVREVGAVADVENIPF